MKQYVTNKTEKIEMGKIIELRGNFTEHETEDGVQYECEYYRTTDKTATFEQMYKAEKAEAAQAFLKATDYQVIKAMELGVDLDSIHPDAHAEREAARETIRSFEDIKDKILGADATAK